MFKIKNINAGLIIIKKMNTDYYTLIGSNIINSNTKKNHISNK